MGPRYYASNKILRIHSDASFLVAPEVKICIARFSHSNNHFTLLLKILVEFKTLKHVVTSAAECEIAAVFYNAQQAIPIQYILNQIGHLQPATPLIMDNTTTECFIKNNITQKYHKSWDMIYLLVTRINYEATLQIPM